MMNDTDQFILSRKQIIDLIHECGGPEADSADLINFIINDKYQPLPSIKRPPDFPHHKWEAADLQQRYVITGQNVKNVLDTVINVIDNPNAQNQFMVAYCIGNLRSDPIEAQR